METTPARPWSFQHYLPGGEEATKGPYGDGRLFVSRLAPADGRVQVDFLCPSGLPAESKLRLECRQRDGVGGPPAQELGPDTRSATIAGLANGVDHRISLTAVSASGGIVLRAPERLARPGRIPGVVVNYIHPEDYTYAYSGRSPASPSLLRHPGGFLLASHDVYWGDAGQNLTKLFRSDDDGASWRFVADLFPAFWGKLFEHRGVLYMLAMAAEYGALLIGASRDGGATWSTPSLLIEGGHRTVGGPHKAPMPVVRHAGRLWTGIDRGSWHIGGHGSGVISAPEEADLLDPESWTVTPFLPYDRSWPGTIAGGEKPHLLEGNVVVTPSGCLVNLLRYNTRGGQPPYGKAIMLAVDKDHPGAPLRFSKVVDFHGNMSKFTVHRDGSTGRYWSLVNRVDSGWVSQRNILTLVWSDDLEHWEISADLLDYEHNGWPEPREKVGFQYVDWFIDGEDILYLSRTALNDAHSYHNANHLTFHRVRGFRSLVGRSGKA